MPWNPGPEPRSLEHHEKYFGCAVYFDSDLDALLLSPETLAQANKLGDDGITRFLLGHLEAELSEVTSDNSLEQHTKDAIANALSEGLPKMGDIARRLGMSVRSLHRRLAEHGLSFQTLTEITRRELAEGLSG